MLQNKRMQRIDNSSPKQTRRRTINRPVGTFAHFLDALISYDYAYFRADKPGFTAYKEEIARHLSINPRHFSRILSGQVLPEARLLTRLSERFPHIKAEGWIPKLTWDCLEKEMELLPDGSVISIFVGHLSLSDVDALAQNVVKNIAQAIGKRGFKYVYFVAPLSIRLKVRGELLPKQLIDRLRLRILSGWLDANPEAKRDAYIEKRLADGLMVFETRALAEAGHFWGFLPRFLAASNLIADKESIFARHQFSAVFDSGSVPYSSGRVNREEHVPDPVTTGGWSYMEEQYDDEFRQMFAMMERLRLFVNPERKGQKFPRPVLPPAQKGP